MHCLGLEKRAKMPYYDHILPFLLRPYRDESGSYLKEIILENGVDRRLISFLPNCSAFFRKAKLPAVLMQMDSTQVRMKDFIAYFGLPEKMTRDDYRKEYGHILNEQFGGTMANLPPELWTDAILSTIKGPNLLPIVLISKYHCGEVDDVVYEETDELEAMEMEILPDWWDTVVH